MLQAYSNDIIVLHNLPNIKIFLELNYCILLVQGRYSSVLHLKVFAPTADSDATTLLRKKVTLIVQLVLDCQTPH